MVLGRGYLGPSPPCAGPKTTPQNPKGPRQRWVLPWRATRGTTTPWPQAGPASCQGLIHPWTKPRPRVCRGVRLGVRRWHLGTWGPGRGQRWEGAALGRALLSGGSISILVSWAPPSGAPGKWRCDLVGVPRRGIGRGAGLRGAVVPDTVGSDFREEEAEGGGWREGGGVGPALALALTLT